MRFRDYRTVLVTLLLSLIIGLSSVPRLAQAQTDVSSKTPTLTIAPIEPQPIGQPVLVTATLKNAEGTPQSNKPLIFYVDGERNRRARTDDNGVATVSLGKDISLGDHALEVVFIGTQAYESIRTVSAFTIRPILLTIETIPRIAQVPLTVESKTYRTDDNGVARIRITHTGTVDLEVLHKPDTLVNPDVRATFVRWSDNEFQASRQLQLRGDKTLQIGFNIDYFVKQTFVDLNNNPVDEARISSLGLRTSTGGLLTFENGQGRWLQATQITRRTSGLEAAKIQYSVESVIIDGANTVNRYQQRFFAEANATWQIQLLLYSATVQATDALLGFSLGSGIQVEYPNGQVVFHAFDANREIHLDSLARGVYKLKVTNVRGMTPWTPVALSRDQDVQLKILSTLDMVIGVVLGATLALALLFYGRPFLIKFPFRLIHGVNKARKSRRSRPLFQPSTFSNSLGGRFDVAFFTPSQLTDGSITPEALTENLALGLPKSLPCIRQSFQISGIDQSNADSIELRIPLGKLIGVVGARGKRGRLLVDIVDTWLTQTVYTNNGESESLQATGDETDSLDWQPLQDIQQRSATSSPKVSEAICQMYAALPESQTWGYTWQHFKLNVKGGRCKNCRGRGYLHTNMRQDGPIECPVCYGTGYKRRILKVRYHNKHIGDVMRMTVSEGITFFADFPVIAAKLRALQAVGMGDVQIGQPGMVLSQRAMAYLSVTDALSHYTIYVFNAVAEPSGLTDANRLIDVLLMLLGDNSTVRVVQEDEIVRKIVHPTVALNLVATEPVDTVPHVSATSSIMQIEGV